MGVGESAETAKKPPKKKFNFRLAFNYACLHDGATTSKNFLLVKILEKINHVERPC
jgi:hypothetical protein